MLITFTVILWQSAGTLSFTIGGTEWNIQGYMVYTVVLIVIGGTLFTHKVGKRIRPLNVEKQRSEDGKTKTHSFNLSFELAEPLHIRQVDINPQIVFSYIKSKGNLSLNNGYEESNTGDNQVVYNGNLVSYDSVPVADFNNPLKISLNMDFTHQPSGLVWANTLAWQEARKARIILGKANAQYISEYSDYKQYVDEKLDSSLTWDTRLSWTPQFLQQQNLTISADILNVLDSKTAVDTTNTGVATYASGRTFWLDVSMKF